MTPANDRKLCLQLLTDCLFQIYPLALDENQISHWLQQNVPTEDAGRYAKIMKQLLKGRPAIFVTVPEERALGPQIDKWALKKAAYELMKEGASSETKELKGILKTGQSVEQNLEKLSPKCEDPMNDKK